MNETAEKGIVRERVKGGLMMRRSDRGVDDILAAIERHNRCMADGEGGRIVKKDNNSRVSIVPDPSCEENGICVKEYRYRGALNRLKDLIRPSQPLREWRAARELERRGIHTPDALAVIIAPLTSPGASHFLLTRELSGALTVVEYAERARDIREKRRFAEALADFLADLHRSGVVHGDMKGSNLLAVEGDSGPVFYIIDLAAARFRKPRGADIELMLAQLYASVPLNMDRADRLRFLMRYLESAGRPESKDAAARRRLMRTAVSMGERRNPVWRR